MTPYSPAVVDTQLDDGDFKIIIGRQQQVTGDGRKGQATPDMAVGTDSGGSAWRLLQFRNSPRRDRTARSRACNKTCENIAWDASCRIHARLEELLTSPPRPSHRSTPDPASPVPPAGIQPSITVESVPFRRKLRHFRRLKFSSGFAVAKPCSIVYCTVPWTANCAALAVRIWQRRLRTDLPQPAVHPRESRHSAVRRRHGPSLHNPEQLVHDVSRERNFSTSGAAPSHPPLRLRRLRWSVSVTPRRENVVPLLVGFMVYDPLHLFDTDWFRITASSLAVTRFDSTRTGQLKLAGQGGTEALHRTRPLATGHPIPRCDVEGRQGRHWDKPALTGQLTTQCYKP
ncbi:hypothetical protein J6590_038334 [Homalodisca vitripennis]|nr:hypothetical protein J6590_038334 [Homalodisca vitripennis]